MQTNSPTTLEGIASPNYASRSRSCPRCGQNHTDDRYARCVGCGAPLEAA